MKRYSLFSLLILSVALLAAQSAEQRVVPRISAITPAIGIEIPIGAMSSLLVQGSFGIRPEVVSTPSFIQTQIIFEPQLSIQPRYYFDLLSRASAGRDVSDYSADFFVLDVNGGRAITQTGNFNRLVITPGIGLQRSFGNRGYISLYAGPSVRLGPRILIQGNWLGFGGQLNLGWRLGNVS